MLINENLLHHQSKKIDFYIDDEVLKVLLWDDQVDHQSLLYDVFEQIDSEVPLTIEVLPHKKYDIESMGFYCLHVFIQYQDSNSFVNRDLEIFKIREEIKDNDDVVDFLKELVNQLILMSRGEFTPRSFGIIYQERSFR